MRLRFAAKVLNVYKDDIRYFRRTGRSKDFPNEDRFGNFHFELNRDRRKRKQKRVCLYLRKRNEAFHLFQKYRDSKVALVAMYFGCGQKAARKKLSTARRKKHESIY